MNLDLFMRPSSLPPSLSNHQKTPGLLSDYLQASIDDADSNFRDLCQLQLFQKWYTNLSREKVDLVLPVSVHFIKTFHGGNH